MDDVQKPSDTEGIVRRQISPSASTAEYDFLSIVARLEKKEMDELPSLHDEVDHLMTRLFQTPPSPEARVEIAFSYAGYRIGRFGSDPPDCRLGGRSLSASHALSSLAMRDVTHRSAWPGRGRSDGVFGRPSAEPAV